MATSKLAGARVALTGGTGFFGSSVAQELLSRGCRLRVASRHPERSFRLRPLANLGQIQFVYAEMARPDSLAAVVDGMDAVVNLVGAFGGDLDTVQGSGAGRLAALATGAGVGAFVHVSAIGANADSEIAYQRTKGVGEAAVLAALPKATILRPSILFGEADNFLNMFASLIASLPALPVFAPDAKLQPLFVDDAAQAVAAALEDPGKHGGKTYEIAGPEVVTMLELNRRIAEAQGRRRAFIPLPDVVGGSFAGLTGWVPGAPISADQYAMLAQGNVAEGKLPGIERLDVSPRPMGLFLDRWMTRYRKHGRFSEESRI